MWVKYRISSHRIWSSSQFTSTSLARALNSSKRQQIARHLVYFAHQGHCHIFTQVDVTTTMRPALEIKCGRLLLHLQFRLSARLQFKNLAMISFSFAISCLGNRCSLLLQACSVPSDWTSRYWMFTHDMQCHVWVIAAPFYKRAVCQVTGNTDIEFYTWHGVPLSFAFPKMLNNRKSIKNAKRTCPSNKGNPQNSNSLAKQEK